MNPILKLFIPVILLGLSSQNAYSQEVDNVIGKKLTINSKVLGENRDIQIYFPESYVSSDKHYPVLYILDGQRLFLQGVSILKTFRNQTKISPEFIVVGINNQYPQRFENFTKADFLQFIDKEVIKHVDSTYRTTKERILYGWEFAGAYVVESLISKANLFSGHIAASPYPVHETWFDKKTRLEQLETKLNKGLDSHLYFAVSTEEPSVKIGTDKLNALLKKQAPDSLRWTYRIIPDEQHLSTAHAAMYQGLRSYFYAYEVFNIGGLDQFEKAGGLKNFYTYTKQRAKRFGFSQEPDTWSMFTIVRNAMRANNIDKFVDYMKEFNQYNWLTQINLDRASSIAQFYAQHQHFDSALKVYKTLAVKHQDSAKIQSDIGKIYISLSNKKLAKQHLKTALDLAIKTNDENTSQYKKALEAL